MILGRAQGEPSACPTLSRRGPVRRPREGVGSSHPPAPPHFQPDLETPAGSPVGAGPCHPTWVVSLPDSALEQPLWKAGVVMALWPVELL